MRFKIKFKTKVKIKPKPVFGKKNLKKKSKTRKTVEPMPVVTWESNLAGQTQRKVLKCGSMMLSLWMRSNRTTQRNDEMHRAPAVSKKLHQDIE